MAKSSSALSELCRSNSILLETSSSLPNYSSYYHDDYGDLLGAGGDDGAERHFPFAELTGHSAATDPTDPHLQARTFFALLWWSNVVVLPIIAVVGLLCNALNLLVLTSNESARRLPSWHLLVALAAFDSLFLIFATAEVTPTSMLGSLAMDEEPPPYSTLLIWHTRTALWIRMLASTFYKASILVVVAFNVERYLCVCRAFWAHGYCTERNNRLAVAGSLLIGLLCSLQWPIAYEVVECEWAGNTHNNSPHPRYYSFIQQRESALLHSYYRTMDYVSLVGFNLAPIVLLAVLNFELVITLRRVVDEDVSRRSSATDAGDMGAVAVPTRNSSTCSGINNATRLSLFIGAPGSLSAAYREDGHQRVRNSRLNANAMLFAVVALLFVCIGPQAPARLLYDYYGHYYHPTAVLYTTLSQLLVFLNASLNFCLYCLVSPRYRAMLAESVCAAAARLAARRKRLVRVVGGKLSSWRKRRGIVRSGANSSSCRRKNGHAGMGMEASYSKACDEESDEHGRALIRGLDVGGENIIDERRRFKNDSMTFLNNQQALERLETRNL